MNDTPAVGKLQAPTNLRGNIYGPLQRNPVIVGMLYDPFHVSATHQLCDHVGLVLFLTQVENSDYVGVGAQPSHGLCFPCNTGSGSFIQSFGLDQGEGHFPVQEGVVSQVDPFLATLAQEVLNLIEAIGEGGWVLSNASGRWCGLKGRLSFFPSSTIT